MAGEGIGKFLKNRTVRIALLTLAALLLLFAVWLVFFRGSDEAAGSVGYLPTEREARLCRLLEEVEGVGDVTAMITEENGVAVSAIVVFGGADSILTRMRVLDITSAALHLDKKYVQVYPAVK